MNVSPEEQAIRDQINRGARLRAWKRLASSLAVLVVMGLSLFSCHGCAALPPQHLQADRAFFDAVRWDHLERLRADQDLDVGDLRAWEFRYEQRAKEIGSAEGAAE